MVYEDILFEWNPGDLVMLQPDYKEVIPPSNKTTNKQPKGNLVHDVIAFEG